MLKNYYQTEKRIFLLSTSIICAQFHVSSGFQRFILVRDKKLYFERFLEVQFIFRLDQDSVPARVTLDKLLALLQLLSIL